MFFKNEEPEICVLQNKVRLAGIQTQRLIVQTPKDHCHSYSVRRRRGKGGPAHSKGGLRPSWVAPCYLGNGAVSQRRLQVATPNGCAQFLLVGDFLRRPAGV